MILPYVLETPLNFYLWHYIKLIDVFVSLLYIHSTVPLVICSCFLPVVLIPCYSNPSVYVLKFKLVLLLLSLWMQQWHSCQTALLYCQPAFKMAWYKKISCSWLKIITSILNFLPLGWVHSVKNIIWIDHHKLRPWYDVKKSPFFCLNIYF